MSNISEQELEKGLFEKEHVLSLPYIRSPRLATELMISCKVSAVAMYLYLIISHNTNATSGISHRIQIKDLAKYVGKKERWIRQCLNELADAGLIVIRSKCLVSGWVFYLPCVEHAARTAKKTAIQAEERKEMSGLDAAVDKAIKKKENELGRALTVTERGAIRNIVERKWRDKNVDQLNRLSQDDQHQDT